MQSAQRCSDIEWEDGGEEGGRGISWMEIAVLNEPDKLPARGIQVVGWGRLGVDFNKILPH
jgi:hypothetical protein